MSAPHLERISAALSWIPSDDRDTWVRMGMALKSELGDDGFAIWDEWSRTSDRYNAKDAQDVWRSCKANGGIGAGTLFHEAKAYGWRDNGTHQKPTPEELDERRRVAAERAAKEDVERNRKRAQARQHAAWILEVAHPASADHPYLVRKKVAPSPSLLEIAATRALEVLGYSPRSRDDLLTGRLLVAPVHVGGELSTAEFIDERGHKSMLRDGAKSGGFWSAQRLPDGDGAGITLLIGEGVATVLSARQATGYVGVAALTSSNLLAVAREMRERFPAAVLTILMDLVKATGAPDPHAGEAARAVGGRVAIPDFGPDRPEGMTDFNDLAQRGLESVAACIASAKAPAGGASQEPSAPRGEEDKKSVSTVLVEIAREQYRFGISHEGEGFAVPLSGPRVVATLRGNRSSLRGQLAGEFFKRTRRAAAQQSVADAMLVIEGMAQEAQSEPLHLRVARHDGALWLDMGDNTGRAIKITDNGWAVEGKAPVLFKRTVLTGVLPEPVTGGSVEDLWRWLNVIEADRPLVIAWLVGTLFPDIPHPVLGIFGEQGTGKTTAQKVLVSVLDPSPVPTRKAPKDAEAWVTAAAGPWVVGLDNLSDISPWLSDSLCRAVTGDGDVRRKLYSDAELAVFAYRRCVLINGMAQCAAISPIACCRSPSMQSRKRID